MPGAAIRLDENWLGSFFYTGRAVICLVVRQERSLSYTPGAVIFRVLKRVGSFSCTARVSSFSSAASDVYKRQTYNRDSPRVERRDRCQNGACKIDSPPDLRPDRFKHGACKLSLIHI